MKDLPSKFEAAALIISIVSLAFSGITWVGLNYYPTQFQITNINPVYFQLPSRLVNDTFRDLYAFPMFFVAELTFTVSVVSPSIGTITIDYLGYSPRTNGDFEIIFVEVSNLTLSVSSGAYQNTVSITVITTLQPLYNYTGSLILSNLGKIMLRADYHSVQWLFATTAISRSFAVDMYFQRVVSF